MSTVKQELLVKDMLSRSKEILSSLDNRDKKTLEVRTSIDLAKKLIASLRQIPEDTTAITLKEVFQKLEKVPEKSKRLFKKSKKTISCGFLSNTQKKEIKKMMNVTVILLSILNIFTIGLIIFILKPTNIELNKKILELKGDKEDLKLNIRRSTNKLKISRSNFNEGVKAFQEIHTDLNNIKVKYDELKNKSSKKKKEKTL